MRNFEQKSYFSVFTHWILRKFDITLYLTEGYNVFVIFKWEIQVYETFADRWYLLKGGKRLAPLALTITNIKVLN